jgi:hypothetical protein
MLRRLREVDRACERPVRAAASTPGALACVARW